MPRLSGGPCGNVQVAGSREPNLATRSCRPPYRPQAGRTNCSGPAPVADKYSAGFIKVVPPGAPSDEGGSGGPRAVITKGPLTLPTPFGAVRLQVGWPARGRAQCLNLWAICCALVRACAR